MIWKYMSTCLEVIMLEIGSVVDGKYKILNKIGQGGMSVVYLAMNERANKQWAIKEVRKDGIANYEVVKQGLIVETDLLKKLNHKNLPSIIDVIDREGTFLMVMDYIEGNPLSYALKESKAMPQKNVVVWAKQLCDVLSYLHNCKPPIIYRDMKPSNVMLKPDGDVMLIDFGTAREFKTRSIADTTCLGTQGYAAPEQFGGQGQTDARTDIYCLGATLYHLITGHNPSEPPYEMCPIRQWNPNLSTGLEKIILKCTRKNPQDRYQTCHELRYDLEHYDRLDNRFRMRQKRKLAVFAASAAFTIVIGSGAFTAHGMEVKTINNSYNAYIESARLTMAEEKIENYRNAISINPEQEEAYLLLLDSFMENGEFTSDDDANLRRILDEHSNGRNRSNESYFKKNEEGYIEFSYRLALLYWYSYTESGNKAYAVKWFNNVVNSDITDEQRKVRAAIFGRIGDYYSELGKRNEAGDESTTYADYWDDLMELYKLDVIDLDNEVTALRLYHEIIFQVFNNTNEFKNADVGYDEMENVVRDIMAKINQMKTSSQRDAVVWELKASILENAKRALRALEVTFAYRFYEEEAGE